MKKSKVQFAASQVVRVEEKKAKGRPFRNIFVKLTPEQREYFQRSRVAAEAEGPPKRSPARPRVEVVLGDDETKLLALLDEYAAKHKLPNRGAVLRVALSKLLKFELPIPHHGWVPGRQRKSVKKPDAKKVKL
jgi:hypothetical protein